jgi:hypothetical protein
MAEKKAPKNKVTHERFVEEVAKFVGGEYTVVGELSSFFSAKALHGGNSVSKPS